MKYDFDEIIDRSHTNSMSFEGWKSYIFKDHKHVDFKFEDKDFIRMWVADMDFATPPEIRDAIKKRLDQKILGYTHVFDPEYFSTLESWFHNHYDVAIKKEEIVFSPGVVPALKNLVPLIMQDDESLLICTPSYAPFKIAGEFNQRRVLTSPLINENGHYVIDFDDLETKISDPKNKISLFILCNPHNPTGRIWTKDELSKLGEICVENNVWIISDEIHCDLLRRDKKHHPMVNILPDYKRLITCTAPSKTFNLAGNLLSHIFIRDDILRAKWLARHNDIQNPLALAAVKAAYSECEEWLDALKMYLDDNLSFLQQYLQVHLPEAKFSIPEATYLAWIDFSSYLKKTDSFAEPAFFFAQEAGVLLEGGNMFVDNGEGHIRLNIACPRSVLLRGLERMSEALNRL
ncbi:MULTISPECIES: MalY/PatB family protein [Vibrio]|uniref:cysteine-S-conjugate beta-lyase n=2 Tax=Vibrio TaxID=662 RepID=A0A7X4LQ12_9VIBR|nr:MULTISPECIES: MalY/PatB family protein [Vibrio]MBF9003595.1 pyridoxal phosphate-dependent aminotransferase [Vibrio nitrifigilis]MZI95727.1 putative C-S lyase [Vibrio eleionomae]